MVHSDHTVMQACMPNSYISELSAMFPLVIRRSPKIIVTYWQYCLITFLHNSLQNPLSLDGLKKILTIFRLSVCWKYYLVDCKDYPTVSSWFLLFLDCLNCNLFGAVIFLFCIFTAPHTLKSPSAARDQVHNININNNKTKEVHSFFEKILQGRAWGAAGKLKSYL